MKGALRSGVEGDFFPLEIAGKKNMHIIIKYCQKKGHHNI